ncbi:hypothetical protein ZHAS_00021964 [Anopheles sinensis]|uniref:Uncharacterized protein n=1 Tax=Anopheles sinensis TaxID=74873 RepID=A0A084WTB4_ANOSI|nr:hypothetical protein ZHAS_00021964 [Anopheles sinensis]
MRFLSDIRFPIAHRRCSPTIQPMGIYKRCTRGTTSSLLGTIFVAHFNFQTGSDPTEPASDRVVPHHNQTLVHNGSSMRRKGNVPKLTENYDLGNDDDQNAWSASNMHRVLQGDS